MVISYLRQRGSVAGARHRVLKDEGGLRARPDLLSLDLAVLGGSPLVNGRTPVLGVDVHFGGLETVVSVRGDVDPLSAPTLGAVMGAQITASGQRPLVLDLAGLTFMDAAGLTVIVGAVNRLAERSEKLVVRSVPECTRRIMDITRLTDFVTLDAGASVDDEVTSMHARREMASLHERRAHEDALDATLRVVTGLASGTVDGADGVSISLRRTGRMTTIAATDATVVQMDDHQYETGQGPCLSAAGEGIPFLVEWLGEEKRWPAFVPRALEQGITSVLSTPLVVAGAPVGALNVYSSSRHFGIHEQEICAVFADAASGLLAASSPVAGTADDQLAARIREALMSRDRIARAQGALIARHGITVLEAAAELHRSARSSDRSVDEAASALLASIHLADTSSVDGADHV